MLCGVGVYLGQESNITHRFLMKIRGIPIAGGHTIKKVNPAGKGEELTFIPT